MATHSNIPAWEIPWTEKPGGLHSMGSQRVGHDWATSLTLILSQYSLIISSHCLKPPTWKIKLLYLSQESLIKIIWNPFTPLFRILQSLPILLKRKWKLKSLQCAKNLYSPLPLSVSYYSIPWPLCSGLLSVPGTCKACLLPQCFCSAASIFLGCSVPRNLWSHFLYIYANIPLSTRSILNTLFNNANSSFPLWKFLHSGLPLSALIFFP